MKNLFSFTLLMFAIALLLVITSLLGCSTENPLCTDNFCVTGEAFPRSELADDAVFSEVDVDDSVILATLVGTPVPVETVPEQPATSAVALADIISDVAAGNTTYLNQTVTVTGVVAYRDAESKDAIVINETNTVLNLRTAFFIEDFGNPATFDAYTIGQSYTFTVTIHTISPPKTGRTYYSLFSRFADENND